MNMTPEGYDLRTHEGREAYGHLLGLPEFPNSLIGKAHVHCGHFDDTEIDRRSTIARQRLGEASPDIVRAINRYAAASQKPFNERNIRAKPRCLLCSTFFVGAFEICFVCAHIYRTEFYDKMPPSNS